MIPPAGNQLFLQNGVGDTITIYNLDASSGKLPSQIDGSPFPNFYVVPFPLRPTIEAIGVLGQRLYIANFAASIGGITVAGFTGLCTSDPCSSPFASTHQLGSTREILQGLPWQLVTSPDLRFL